MSRIAPALALLLAVAAAHADAAPSADLHQVKWFVHVDLTGGGADLAFYESLLDGALEDSRVILEGSQGPADSVCCNQLEKEEHSPGVTLATFGTSGDGLDVMGPGELDTLRGIGGGGSRAFLIDSITDCGGSPAIGCADLPACDGTPDDDPDRIMVVTLDASDQGVLGLVIAHERGHNACLAHVANTPCELMRAIVAGGCLSPAECDAFSDARQKSGGSCACHADGPGDPQPEPDGLACTDGPISGICSGGVCGEADGDAGVQLLAAGGSSAETGQATVDPLLHSGVPGGWTDLGDFGGPLRGLAYDPDAGVLYGVMDVPGDDLLVRVDPQTGATSDPLSVAGHADLLALAFDPGPTPGTGDDRLLALSTDGTFEDLIEIDPSDGSPTFLGGLSIGVMGNFQGLAYDEAHGEIYASGFGLDQLYRIDTSTCPYFCTAVGQGVDLPRIDSSLAYSRESGNLYLVGRQSNSRILYDTIDPATLTTATTVGIDVYTVGALSALPTPLPEPAPGLSLAAGALLLGALAGRRRPASAAERPGQPVPE